MYMVMIRQDETIIPKTIDEMFSRRNGTILYEILVDMSYTSTLHYKNKSNQWPEYQVS